MIRYRRPAKPVAFTRAVTEAIAAVRTSFGQLNTDEKVEFPNEWGPFKQHFFVAQHDKCGYCESNVRAVTNGDVEHYFPKAEVQQLDNEGVEANNLSNVRGRNGLRTSIGYWWRAYDWDNYLLSCGNCNSKWKRNFFPVEEDPRHSFPLDEANGDHPLILNPFGRASPENHLRFHRDRSVTGLTDKGRATIRICGLDRPCLRGARTERTERTSEWIDVLSAALSVDDETRITDALRGLHRLGAARHAYAGVARSLLKHETGLTWAEVEAFVIADIVARIKTAEATQRPVVIQDLKAREKDFYRRDRLDEALVEVVRLSIDELIAELGSG